MKKKYIVKGFINKLKIILIIIWGGEFEIDEPHLSEAHSSTQTETFFFKRKLDK